jgi:hypothetical protein
VKEQIESGKHDSVDKYVGSLKEFKYDNQKAANGLYANIHAKRARIAAGSGERMRKPGEAGAPTAEQFKQAAKTAKAEDGVKIMPPVKQVAVDATRVEVKTPSMDKPKVVETEKIRMVPVGPLVPFNYYQEKRKKEKQKAENGVVINPPTKAIAESSTTQVQTPMIPELDNRYVSGNLPFLQYNKIQKKALPPNLIDLAKKSWNRYSNNGQDRTLVEVAANFIPHYEQFVDAKDLVSGMFSGNKEQMNSGVLGMAAPIAGKAVLSGMDYITEKALGKKVADSMAIARNDIVNMTDAERRNLFIKYHNKGGYSQWVKEGRPDLLK